MVTLAEKLGSLYLTEEEGAILNFFWSQTEAIAIPMIAELGEFKGSRPQATLDTAISSLKERGLLKSNGDLYEAAVSRKDYASSTLENIKSWFSEGKGASMAGFMLDHRILSQRDMERAIHNLD